MRSMDERVIPSAGLATDHSVWSLVIQSPVIWSPASPSHRLSPSARCESGCLQPPHFLKRDRVVWIEFERSLQFTPCLLVLSLAREGDAKIGVRLHVTRIAANRLLEVFGGILNFSELEQNLAIAAMDVGI